MYEIDLSTLLLIGIDDSHTKVVTIDSEFVINASSKKIMDKNDGKTILNWCKSHLSFGRYLTILEKAKYCRFKVFLKKIARIS